MTVLRVTDIEPYEHNPRQSANPLFETIKASIRQRGMDAPLKVTRRPGAAHYVVAAGGNTRLLAQLQLWQETADRRFETVPVVIKAWCSESDVLAGHLIENEQRSDLTFWDKAQGVVALKAALEQERAAALSLRQWESALLDLGLQIGKDVLSTYLFAVERLAPLGPVMATLSRHDVRDQLQPRFRCWARLAQRFGLGEAALYAHTLDPVLRRFAESYQTTRSFDATELAQQGELALAQTLQMAVPALQSLLALLDQSPELALDALRARGALALADGSNSTVPAVTSRRYRQANGIHHADAVSPGDSRFGRSTGGGGGGGARRGDGRSAFHCLPGRQAPSGGGRTGRTGRRARRGCPGAAGLRAPLTVSPGDSHRTEGDAGTATDLATDPVDALQPVLLAFAEATHCADCLHWHAGLPFRFYVEVPTLPLDLNPARPQRHAGWWLLAFLSGQLDPDVAGLLPDDSAWRRAVVPVDEDTEGQVPLLIPAALGGQLAADALVAWLTRPPDVAGERAWQCLQRARQVWAARLHAAPPDDPPASSVA
ncbi:MAG: ParB N-terminal domain-containing protein [Betaproteobacteria bacterium]|nr:ParB N-terminal domain-containing protein [Betaproteobacteria bacterium]